MILCLASISAMHVNYLKNIRAGFFVITCPYARKFMVLQN